MLSGLIEGHVIEPNTGIKRVGEGDSTRTKGIKCREAPGTMHVHGNC